MKFETIKNKKKILLIGIILFCIGVTLFLATSLANYRKVQSIPIASGKVNYIVPDMNIVAINLQTGTDEEGNITYDSATSVPKFGYVLNTEKSYCANYNESTKELEKINNTIEYDRYNKMTSIKTPDTLMNKGTKCYFYYDKGITISEILASKEITTRTDYSVVFTEDTTGKLFEAQDDDGTTYYYAGAPTDNFVEFAGFYWRIIRINGNGSVRMIYQGKKYDENGNKLDVKTVGAETEAAYSMFSNVYFQSAVAEHVGLKYTEGEVHGTDEKSTILKNLESWYSGEDNELKKYEEHLDRESGFCGDRSITSGTGIGTSSTYYGAHTRLVTNKAPSYKCPYVDESGIQQDLYTVENNTNKGNQALTYPVGLITADEVSFAGGVYNINNTSYYLYTGKEYWTMTPSRFNYSYYPRLFHLYENDDYNGALNAGYTVDMAMGIRPVINLNTVKLTMTGSGTIIDPYVIS
ncbi:MAG: hypothetical protein E7163_00080 [Firmicutes bacterium]|nr:hypothetical protein [Bacillota bacterium]